MNKIGIIGAGSMGSGIAQVAALNGCDVVLVDLNQETLQKALEQIQKILNKLAEKGTISNEHAVQAMGYIHMSQNIQSLSDTDLVIEAIIENIDVKNKDIELEMMYDQQAAFARYRELVKVRREKEKLQSRDPEIYHHYIYKK